MQANETATEANKAKIQAVNKTLELDGIGRRLEQLLDRQNNLTSRFGTVMDRVMGTEPQSSEARGEKSSPDGVLCHINGVIDSIEHETLNLEEIATRAERL